MPKPKLLRSQPKVHSRARPPTTPNREEAHEFEHSGAREEATPESSLSEDEVAALASSIIEAKQDEVQAHAPADAIVGGAAFDEDDEEEDEEGEGEEVRAIDEVEVSDDAVEETENVEEVRNLSPLERAEIEADAAHEEAVHAAETGAHSHDEGHEQHEHARRDLPS